MFYGRVDVYWPDGPVESYRLNKPTIAIGRSTGNDIVLDTTAISRYHITLSFQNQQAVLEDLESVNGTYVDSIRLAAHEPYVLRGGEEIQIGDIRVIFHPPVLDSAASADTTRRVVLSQPTYRVELEGPDMAVAPGAHVQATLKIENLGGQADRYFVEIDSLPKGWARVDRVELEIESGESAQAVISLKPLRRSESQPGDHPFVVRVRSKSKPAETIDAPATLQVLPFSGFGMALGNSHVNDAGFKLYLHNQGNAPLPLMIQGTDPAQVLRFHLSAGQIQLGPGERQTLAGTIRLRRQRLFGQPREREFALVAQALDPSGFVAAVPGTYLESGLLPGWVPVLVVPVLVVAALLVFSLAMLLLGANDDESGVQPAITALTVENPAITLGEIVAVRWDVSGAESLELIAESGGEQTRYPMEAGMTSFTLAFDQTGIYTLTLEARNKQRADTAAVQVEVRPAVMLGLEVLDGTELVRNVRQDVRVSWSVKGAREFDGAFDIWMESADQGGILIAAPLPESGQQDVQVVPQGEQSEWLVTLYAQGRDDVTAKVPQKLPIVYPSCELDAARTIVRSGPGDVYPALVPPLESSPQGNLSLSPIARDPSGDWLQVTIGVDDRRPGWVLRDDFVCANFDPEQLVITGDFPPPPVETSPPGGETQPTVSPAAPSSTPVPAFPTPTIVPSPT